jgi:hypothetical protein
MKVDVHFAREGVSQQFSRRDERWRFTLLAS